MGTSPGSNDWRDRRRRTARCVGAGRTPRASGTCRRGAGNPPGSARPAERGDAAALPLLVHLAAWCALRFGELTELRRGDTAEGVLRVRRAVVLVDGRFVAKTPKSDAGRR